MTGPELALLLGEASHAARASLASALGTADGQPAPRIGWLVQHVSVNKRACWEAISGVLTVPRPGPELNLDELCVWEVEQAAQLQGFQLETKLEDADAHMSVAEALRLNARDTVWHAGQIAALSGGPRLA